MKTLLRKLRFNKFEYHIIKETTQYAKAGDKVLCSGWGCYPGSGEECDGCKDCEHLPRHNSVYISPFFIWWQIINITAAAFLFYYKEYWVTAGVILFIIFVLYIKLRNK